MSPRATLLLLDVSEGHTMKYFSLSTGHQNDLLSTFPPVCQIFPTFSLILIPKIARGPHEMSRGPHLAPGPPV